MKWETKLLKILNDANTPHCYLVSDILEWASGAAADGYSFPSAVPTRTTLIRNIEHHWTGSQYIVRSKQTMVPCPARPGLSIPVVWFDFLEQVANSEICCHVRPCLETWLILTSIQMTHTNHIAPPLIKLIV